MHQVLGLVGVVFNCCMAMMGNLWIYNINSIV